LIISLFNNKRNKIKKKKLLLSTRFRSDLQLHVTTISWIERETTPSRIKRTTKRISNREPLSFFRDSSEVEPSKI